MGRHSKKLRQPGESVGFFLRQLQEESGLTWRQISEIAHVGHNTLSQNADGRLTATEAPIRAWIDAFYKAVEHHEIEMSQTKEDALAIALNLWKECRAYQHKLHRRPAIVPPPPGNDDRAPAPTPEPVTRTAPDDGTVSLPTTEAPHDSTAIAMSVPAPRTSPPPAAAIPPPADVPPRDVLDDPKFAAMLTNRTPPSLRTPPARPAKPTVPLPPVFGGAAAGPKRVTPDNLYQATSVGDLVAALTDMINKVYYNAISTGRYARLGPETGSDSTRPVLDSQILDVLNGSRWPTPGIIHRIVKICGGTTADHAVWKFIAEPILAALPATGRAPAPRPRADRRVRRADPEAPTKAWSGWLS